MTPPKVPPAPATAPGVDPGAGADTLTAGLAATREHLRKTGTALGTAATAVIGGLGYARLHDLFPIPVGKDWLYWVAGVAAAAAVLGSVVLAGRFFGAQRRILLSSRLPTTQQDRWRRGLRKTEVTIVTPVFQEHAREEGAASLHALDLRAVRLEHVAGRIEDEDARKRFEDEAQHVRQVVRIGLVRGVASILEYRAQQAFKGWISKVALVSAVTGVALLWGAADYSKGQRDLIDLRAKCAEAEGKGAATACEPVVPTEDDAKAKEARDAAKRKQEQDVAAAARELKSANRDSLTTAQACNTVVESRLKDAPESVRAAAVSACIRPPE
jgi:hypothetical protein